MKLVEHQHCVLIEDSFASPAVAGFSKSNLAGNLPQDIHTALSFLNKEFKVAYLKQIHSSKVFSVDKEGCYEGDALFTKSANLALVVKTADCLPLFFESRKLGVVGVVHMGWRSAKVGILDNIPYSLESFKVAAGVGLRKSCYEVSDGFLTHESFRPFVEKINSKFYFNPVEFAKNKLRGSGLKEDSFIDLDICSFCNQSKFFSCRRDNTSSRTLSFIVKL